MSSALVAAMLAARPRRDRRAPALGRDRAGRRAVARCWASARSALAVGRSGDFLVASLVLLTKAVVLPVLLLVVVRRTREPRLVAPAAPRSCAWRGAGAVALAATALVPPLGLGDAQTEQTAVALVLVGIAIVVARRPAFLQLLGLIVAENGLSLLAVSVPGGLLVRRSSSARCSTWRSSSPSRSRSPSASTSSSGPATPSCCGGCMTELVGVLAAVVPALPLACAVALQATRTPAQADRLNIVAAVATAATALVLAALVLAHDDGAPMRGACYLARRRERGVPGADRVVGLCSALMSPGYLRTAGRSWFSAGRSRHRYYAALYVFWAALLAVPIAGNLAVAWLLVEATTAASALLVAFTGARHALEAGWKYLVLTTLGLSVALLGIVVLALGAGGRGRARAERARLARAAEQRGRAAAGGDARGLRADPRGPGDEDRLGAGPQLAARRAQRGAGADQRAAVRGAAADRRARGLAREDDARRRRWAARRRARCSSASAWPR